MKTLVINGVEFCNFGSNGYSHGMELITCYPMPKNLIQDVLDGKYEGVYLNPSAPCNEEFYGVLGTEEQYEEFYEEQKDAQIAKAMMQYLDIHKATPEEYRKAKEKIESEYKDWWKA